MTTLDDLTVPIFHFIEATEKTFVSQQFHFFLFLIIAYSGVQRFCHFLRIKCTDVGIVGCMDLGNF